ncbi:MAG: hypothetical protein ACTSWN_02085 [Promethearchaeota archaeon]
MVNVGVLGDVSVGKTTILRLFLRYVESGKLKEILNGTPVEIVKTDFAGEATLPSTDAEKKTKTIHPNRVVFKIGEDMHTLFAPGGDKRPLVRMGIVTVSRIARMIITVFDLTQDLDTQLEFYESIRFIPKVIVVALNKADLIKDINKKVDEFTKKIKKYFRDKRKLDIADFYVTVAKKIDNYKDKNDECINMIVKVVNSGSEAK